MPALLPVPGVARVVYSGDLGATNWANVLHVAQFNGTPPPALETDPWTQTQINNLATLMSGLWQDHFRALLSTGVTLTSTSCTDLTDEFGVVGTNLTNRSGTITGSIPSNCSCCVSWREALHYRGGHPRTYLPPPSSTQTVSSNRWTTTYQQAVEVAMNAFIAALEADATVEPDGLALVAVHRQRGFLQIDPPQVVQITSALVDPRIDSQRRRLGPDL